MDAEDLPPLVPVRIGAAADPEALSTLDAPLCEACGSLERMQPSEGIRGPYWTCATCGAVRLA